MTPARNKWTSLAAAAFAVSCCLATGCSMCCHPYDYSYTYYGSRWERADMERGRVGSAFYRAGEQVAFDQPPAAPSPPLKKVEEEEASDEEPLKKESDDRATDGEDSSEEESNSDQVPTPKKKLTEPISYRREAQRAFRMR